MNLAIAKSGLNVNLQIFLIHFKNICVITPLQLPIRLQSMLIKTRQKLTPPHLYFLYHNPKRTVSFIKFSILLT